MSWTTVDLAAARRTLRALTPRTVALLASMADPGVSMSGSEWTVGEAAAHLVFGAKDYSEHARGVQQCYSIDPTDRAGSHRRNLAAMVQRGSHQLGAEWPIETEAARLAVQAVLPLLPALVDSEAAKGVDATYELAVRGGPCVMARFRNGTGSIDPSENGPVDCRLSGDPVAWLLTLYGRVGWEELLRTGRVTVTGGDAALGAGFKRLLRNP